MNKKTVINNILNRTTLSFVIIQALFFYSAYYYCSRGGETKTWTVEDYCQSYASMQLKPEYSPFRDVFVRPVLVYYGASRKR